MPRGTTTRNAATNSVAYVNARSRISIYRSTHDARRTTHGHSWQLLDHVVVRLGATIPEELPGPAHLLDHVEVHLRDYELVFVLAAFRQEVSARIHEVARAVELADVPRCLDADPIDTSHEVAVCHRVRGLLELPQVLRQALHRRRRIEHDLGTVQAEQSRAFGEVAVIADVDADRGVPRLEDGIAEVAGLEEELLPEAGRVRDVDLAVLAEVAAVGVDDGGGVVVDTRHLALIDRHDHHHLVFLRELLHPLDRRAGNRLGDVVPLGVLARTEVGAVEHFLQTKDLHALLACFLYIGKVLLEHCVADLRDRRVGIVDGVRHLDEATDDFSHYHLEITTFLSV